MNTNIRDKAILSLASAMVSLSAFSQSTDQNYLMETTMLDANSNNKMTSVQYYNGLGYPTVSVSTTGDGGQTTYDAQGRVFRKYVPVPGSGLSYMNESSVRSLQYPFYSDNSGFEQYHYDGLNRTTATDIAGDRWRQAGKQNRTAYLANTDNDMVMHYEAPEDGTYRLIEPEDASFSHYPEGTLSKVVSYDADDKCVTVFTDLFGKKILERTDAGDTYYVYNALGQLRFVLTPGYNKKSRSKTIFAYEYRYDDRGRMFMKILPKDSSSGSVTHYCYDRADRMAYMKDPALGSRYRFYLYDKYGRLCVQGTCSSGQQDSAILATTTYGGNTGVQYDCNGNITRLQRRGLVDNKHGAFGLVDDLYMSYNGNQLTSVRDNSTHSIYAGATDFYTDSSKKEYPLTYNGAGSLVSDAGRKIAKIDYDQNNNPVRIQFTNGNVTKYIYSAMGEKLRVTYQTAVPNISVAIGKTKELAPSEILSTDYTDYLLGGSLTLKNGRIDKYQFDEGYCQAEKYIYNTSQDEFTFCYYDKDHLGNIHQVTEPDGSKTGNVIQKINYYPFGAQFCDGSTDSNVQSHKYNGKEFDKMHGLNTYDYGARQYNPITARWDRMDPLCEKYYSVSPYAYCINNPIMFVDLHGDSITLDNQSIAAIYNGLEDGSHIHMKFNNGVLDPSSISEAVSSSEDTFLQDLYEIAINPQMVEMKVTDANTYIMDGRYIQDETWTTPYDIDYSKEFPSALDMPTGLTIAGNTGQTLFPINVGKGPKFSTNKNIQININGKSRNINHQTIGIGHEFGHVVLFLRGKNYSHPDRDVDSFIDIRVNTLKKRLGYDN